jgi:7-carboxy-7-deazaguanine synthase (Cx14CxxC type)
VSYAVKEIYYTLQGEGANTGRPIVMLRFAGCNLWTGREEDRADAVCRFCDTDIVGTDGPKGDRYGSAEQVADVVVNMWPGEEGGRPSKRATGQPGDRLVVCTGGEPCLQLDDELVSALHDRGFAVAIESNGTVAAPSGLDWICVSPKAGTELVQLTGDELKLVFPQDGLDPQQFEQLRFTHFYLQPLDDAKRDRNTLLTVQYCKEHPRWRLSLQTHKLLGIP